MQRLRPWLKDLKIGVSTSQVPNHPPRVSVIIPARNEGGRIERCLAAIVAQDIGCSFEIIVVDNGSADDTASRAAAYPVRLVSEGRPGRATARNAGIRAARGDILVFTDADCLPGPSWLRELLAGANDPEQGCFIGELEPLETRSMVANYIHQQGMINQARLLSQAPPVAATGNIAYRKEVFEAVGLFDDTFFFGEDGDFFWRMVRSEGFRYSYHPRAVVYHPHPSTVSGFLCRSFWEGTGVARFRRKHSDCFPSSYHSTGRSVISLVRVLLGCLFYPMRVLRGLVKPGMSWRYALGKPFLDKTWSLSFSLGVLYEYCRRPFVPVHGMTLSGEPAGLFSDQLRLDLGSAPLLSRNHPALLEQVRRELERIGASLADHFQDASVLLTGSFFAGEGRYVTDSRECELLSDYDLFVITPRLIDAVPGVIRSKLDRLAEGLSFSSARLEIGVIWKPLLRFNLTTVGGGVISGNGEIVDLLTKMPAPSGFSSLLQAYSSLTAASRNRERYACHCAGALVRAARALLLAEKAGRPRSEWIALSSMRALGEMISSWKPVLGSDAVVVVQEAAAYLLGCSASGPDWRKHQIYVNTINAMALRVPLCSGGSLAARYIHDMLSTSRFGMKSRPARQALLKGFQALADSWSPAGIDRNRLAVAMKAAEILGLNKYRRAGKEGETGAADDLPGRGGADGGLYRRYALLQDSFSRAVSHKRHRFIYTKNGGAR